MQLQQRLAQNKWMHCEALHAHTCCSTCSSPAILTSYVCTPAGSAAPRATKCPHVDTAAAQVPFCPSCSEPNCRMHFIDRTSQRRTQFPLLEASNVLHATAAVSAFMNGEAGTNASASMGRECAAARVATGHPAAISIACKAQSDVDTSAMLEDRPFWHASALQMLSSVSFRCHDGLWGRYGTALRAAEAVLLEECKNTAV